jgi:hypothetical protein
MAVKWPSESLSDVGNLRSAQNLYAKLGRYLSGAYPKGGPTERMVDQKGWRREARDVRRRLEEEWGSAVRLTSASRYATGVGGTGVGGGRKKAGTTLPTWSMRSHFTVEKPAPVEIGMRMLYIPLDGVTYEPLGVFFDSLDGTRKGLSDALAALQSSAEAGRSVPRRVSLDAARAAALDGQIAQLDKIIGSLKELERRRDRLQRELDTYRQQARTAGGPMGAGAD